MTEPVNQMTDGALLAAFSATGNQTAFAEIVQRHGAMVHGVCLRGLGDHHEAEDAAQAVFVTLARKAASLRKEPSVGGWLHTVARRLAKDMRRSRAARQRREEMAMSDAAVTGNEGMDPRLFRESLDDAIGGLPDRYRRPLVLFHLEGRSLQQTADQLGLTASATGVRLSRARELLRKKLVRRGVTVGSVDALTALLSAESGAAVLPATFVASTVKAATGGAVSTTVAALSQGAIQAMFIAKVKTVSLAAAACLVVAGTGVVAAKQLAGSSTSATAQPESFQVAANPQSVQPQTPALPAVPESLSPRPTPAAPVVEGKIVKGLQLALSADKTETTPDGVVKLTIALVNPGTEPIKYLQYPQVCGPWLKVTGPDGKPIQCIRDPRAPQASLAAPDREHVKELAPGAKWEHVAWVAWTVLDPPVENRNRITGKVIRRYDGCGWDIRKSGRYTIVAYYGSVDDARRINAKDRANVWDGEVESNPVVLTVKPAE